MKAIPQKTDSSAPAKRFDVARVRQDFPILKQKIHGKPLVYFDNGATSQKPQAVIDALARLLQRGKFQHPSRRASLSERATAAYEAARGKVRGFINAPVGPRRLSSCAAPPKRSIWWRRATAAVS